MRGRLAALTTLLAGLIAGCRSVPPPSSGSTGQPFSCDHFDPALLSQAIFEETNRAREIHGVEPLEHIAGLDEAADLQAFHMSLMFVSEHGNPIPGEANAGERAEHAGVAWSSYAENVLMEPAQPPLRGPEDDSTYSAFARYLVDCWMGSPPHRAHLLDPSLTGMGSSARFSHSVFGYPMVFASQVFITKP
jgi:uncharacterized protein YkwD